MGKLVPIAPIKPNQRLNLTEIWPSPGLLPLKTGPKSAYKLTPEVIAFIQHQRTTEELTWQEIVEATEKQFYPLHLRTVQRALRGKK